MNPRTRKSSGHTKLGLGYWDDAPGEVGQSSTVPPPAPPPSHEEPPPHPTTALEDQVHELTTRFDAFWDETQEHQVSIIQDVDVLQADVDQYLYRDQISATFTIGLLPIPQ